MEARLTFKVALAAAVGLLAYSSFSGAHAQGFADEPTCYSWNGGHKSAGSFSKCSHWVVQAAAPAPAPVVVPAPVVQAAPVQVMQSCPPPERPPIVRKHKVRPKVICKPVP